MKMKGDTSANKSAGKSRKTSTPIFSSTPSVDRTRKFSSYVPAGSYSSNGGHKPFMMLEENQDNKLVEYENYRITGDFQSDFVNLAFLLGIKLIISHRVKVPLKPQSPGEPNNITRAKDDRKITNSFPSQDSLNSCVHGNASPTTDNPQPTTYTLATNKYEYFKPHVEIETEFELNTECIKHLYLRGWRIDTRVIQCLSKTLPQLQQLSSLDLWSAGLVDETLEKLAECLSPAASLKTLRLDGNSFVRGQRYDLFLTERNKLCLENLSLRNCNLDATGALHLADVLKENKNLLTLNLCFNNIGDTGAKHLAGTLRLTNRTLLSLDVGRNDISDAGVRCIAESISTFCLTHDEVVARRLQMSLHINVELNQRPSSPEGSDSVAPTKNSKSSKKKDGTPGKGKDKRGKSSWEKMKTRKVNTLMKIGRTDNPDEEDSLHLNNPLLEKVRVINGELWIDGNHSLINLNLSRNKVSSIGVELLYEAIRYQVDSSLNNPAYGTGMMRLPLKNNLFSTENISYVALMNLLESRDPLLNPAATPEENA